MVFYYGWGRNWNWELGIVTESESSTEKIKASADGRSWLAGVVNCGGLLQSGDTSCLGSEFGEPILWVGSESE